MRDLAQAVGIKGSSIYNHFLGKEEILVRISLDGMRAFYEGAVACVENLEDVEERLRALIQWQVHSETDYPYAARVSDAHIDALNPEGRRDLLQLRDAFEQLLTDVLIEGQDQGRWALSSPRVICLGIIGMCKIDAWYKESGSLTVEQIGDIYASFVLNALLSGGAAHPIPPVAEISP